jgi:eukaryotic-like serine/threonine-protein kinase
MTPKEDARFLALLVHRGYLDREAAEGLLPALKGGEPLDDLLIETLGWEEKRVARLRRTRAGEEPEIPGYEVLGRLGMGGTADVFSAREKKTGRTMALKVLNPRCTRDPRQLKAFVLEARLLERLDHPGLVKGFGVARTGDTYFSRLEMIDGRTLLEHLDDGQCFEEEVALRVVLAVAEVLQYMASENLVHRDVKPGNIMLSSNAQVKLIDLGFCAEQNECNPEDSAVGTVQYLSPEQAEGGARADLRSDIYALGVTLFQLTVGRLPFEGDTDQDTLRRAVMDSLASPELKSRGLSPHLHYFIEKMMAKEAEVRYQGWEELTSDISEQLAGRESLDYRGDAPSRSGPKSGVLRRRQGRRK